MAGRRPLFGPKKLTLTSWLVLRLIAGILGTLISYGILWYMGLESLAITNPPMFIILNGIIGSLWVMFSYFVIFRYRSEV